MADAGRQPAAGVVAAILAEAPAFSFFQVVRLLENYCGGAAVGGTHPGAEPVRLQPSAELCFPRSSVAAVEELTSGARYRVTANFFGLYGTTSPLPTFLSEDILMFDGERDGARDLLDVINHRLLSLFYRAWRKYRYDVCWRPGGTDETSAKIFALCGLASPDLRAAVGVPAVRLLRYVGLLTLSARSAAALRGILTDYFETVACTVAQCVQRWVWLDAADHWRLGRRNGRLGQSSTAGLRVADRSGKFRIGFGPMDRATYLTFLPHGSRFVTACALTRFVVRDSLAFDIEARLRHDDIPLPKLTRDSPPRLGWTSWLGQTEGDGVVVFRVPTNRAHQPNGGEAAP